MTSREPPPEGNPPELRPRSPSTFVRQATGLVRGVSPWHALIISTIITNYGIGLAFTFGTIPAVLPGANIGLAFILAIPFTLISGLLYVWFTQAMPRSGGEYVWISRTLFPWLAVGLDLLFIFVVAILYGSVVNYLLSLGLSIGIGSIGLSLGIPSLAGVSAFFASTSAIIGIGTLIIIVAFAITILPLRHYLRVQTIFWVIGMIGLLVFFGAYASTSNSAFIKVFDGAFAGYNTTYSGVISSAAASGFSNPGLITLGIATLLAIPYCYFVVYGYQFGSYMGGELRSAKKSMIYSALIGGAISCLVEAAAGFITQSSIGANFLNAVSSGVSNYGAPVPFNVFLFPVFILHNAILDVLLIAGLFAWGLIIISAGGITLSRVLLGWGFDRALPAKLAYVSGRLQAPVIAVAVYIILTELGLLASVYYGFIFSQINIVIVEVVLIAVIGFAAMVFPYRRKDLFSVSPLSNSKIGSIPSMTIIGAIDFAIFLVLTALVLEYPSIGGPNGPFAIGLLVGIFLIGAVAFLVTQAYYKSRGVPVETAFREIPPE